MQFLALYASYFLFISCILQIYYPAKAQKIDQFSSCNTTANYTSGSVYEQNLNITLTFLVANAFRTGFYVTSMGQINDLVYGLVQCRGDLSKIDCQACANKAATEITQLCFSQKEASVGYINCSLQYSDRRFFSTFDSFPRVNLHDVQTATDPVLFKRQVGNLVKNPSSKAASDPSKFAIGVTSYTDFNDIYGMTQCTQDLAENSCLTCLQEIASYVSECWDGFVGITLISKSCYLRYEIYSFFQSPLQHPPPAAASSPFPSLLEPNSSTSGTNKTSPGKKKISKTIIIIVIPLLVGFVMPTSCACCLLWKRTRRNGVDTSLAWQHWAKGTSLELLDPSLGDQWPRYEVLKCIHIGLLCVQEATAERPTMSEVVMMLNSYTTTSAVPSQPAFYIRQESSTNSQKSGGFELDKLEDAAQSVNDLTVSDLHPR